MVRGKPQVADSILAGQPLSGFIAVLSASPPHQIRSEEGLSGFYIEFAVLLYSRFQVNIHLSALPGAHPIHRQEPR